MTGLTPSGNPEYIYVQIARPPPADPAQVFRACLASDPRFVICVSPPHRLRRTLTSIAEHLCFQARPDLTEPPPPGPAAGGGICDPASATRTAAPLRQQAGQVIAADCLRVLGFNPRRATSDRTYFTGTVKPVLARASRRQARALLLDLAAHLENRMDAAGTAGLDQHATTIHAARLLSMILDGLLLIAAQPATPDQSGQPSLARVHGHVPWVHGHTSGW